MSKGLGHLQIKILNSLGASKHEFYYHGSDYNGLDHKQWIFYKRCSVLLPTETYDLRAVLSFLSKQQHRNSPYTKYSFQASFSRAINGLIDRGHLQAPTMLKIDGYKRAYGHIDYTDSLIHNLSDGMYLICNERQKRFVVKCYEN